MVSAVNCVRLKNHRPLPPKQIIHYNLKKEINFKNKIKTSLSEGQGRFTKDFF